MTFFTGAWTCMDDGSCVGEKVGLCARSIRPLLQFEGGAPFHNVHAFEKPLNPSLPPPPPPPLTYAQLCIVHW